MSKRKHRNRLRRLQVLANGPIWDVRPEKATTFPHKEPKHPNDRIGRSSEDVTREVKWLEKRGLIKRVRTKTWRRSNYSCTKLVPDPNAII